MLAFVTTATVVAFCAGLVVGWHVLPQPEWVKSLYAKVFG